MSRPVMVSIRLDDLVRLHRERDEARRGRTNWRRDAKTARRIEEYATETVRLETVRREEMRAELAALRTQLAERDARDEALRAETLAFWADQQSIENILDLRERRPLMAAFVGPPWAEPDPVDGVSS